MPVSVDVAIPCPRSLHRPSPSAPAEATTSATIVEAPHPDVPLSPILEFQFFHKAIRTELERLYQDAVAAENGGEEEFLALRSRYDFLRVVYTQHSNAEDEVIFPALDIRVKNIAQTYSLEHKEECDLFDQMLVLLTSALNDSANASEKLRKDLICCTEVIQTTLCKHMSKEEEQVFPLLIQHLSFEEQAGLVWQFICSIPVNLMEEFLPWIASCLSSEERQAMIACMHSVVPKEDLLRKVVFAWLNNAGIMLETTEMERMDAGEVRMDVLAQAETSQDIIAPTNKQNTLQESVAKSIRCGCVLDHNNDTVKTFGAQAYSPIDTLMSWHNAIREELIKFTQAVEELRSLGIEYLPIFSEHLQFLAEICIFHSAAEEKIMFPAIAEKAKQPLSYSSEHLKEEYLFKEICKLLEDIIMEKNAHISTDMYRQICTRAEMIAQTVKEHLADEESKVFPIVRNHCTIEEQQFFVYQSLCVMPLKLLERVLPWLATSLQEEEAKAMFENIRLAAPTSHAPLVTLLLGWACRGRTKKPSADGCFFMNNISGCIYSCGTYCSMSSTEIDCEDYSSIRSQKRARCNNVIDSQEFQKIQIKESCCVPGLGVNGSSISSGVRSFLQSMPNSQQGGDLGSGLTSPAIEPISPKPIDTIFQFHKAIRKDLEYLDIESARLADCDDRFLRQFRGRFQLLRGLYCAHSNAEDVIVFPALEAKEALHNVSHSYTIDHKHEERLFQEIANVLSELTELQTTLVRQDCNSSLVTQKSEDGSNSIQNVVLYKQTLAAKLQRMCKSIHVTLDQHVSREELELWPLFSLHFSVEEQEKLVGQIIGSTGAEVLQAMLPWVTTALTEEEQNSMMYTVQQATRNTMFENWLRAWWKQSPSHLLGPSVSDDELPESGTPECLQLVADYLSKSNIQGNDSRSLRSIEPPDTPIPSERQSIANTEASVSCASSSFDGGGGYINGRVLEGKIQQCVTKFKPGWQDIFRMNEKELEAAVRKVSGDPTLDHRRKAYLMQNLLTSRWIVAQQHPLRATAASVEDEDIPGRSPSYTDMNKDAFGCEHYKRNCKVRAVCCGILFPCRFCHDEVSDHTMDRQAIEEMMCMQCLRTQPIGQYCSTLACNRFCMAKYYCNICKLFDDSRDIYHCPSCNVCRVGKGLGIDFFHCMTCNSCMSTSLTSHKCRERGMESNCPICHDFLFTSHTPVKALSCGHFMHSACYGAYTYSHYTCPICCKTLGDMNVYFGMLDALLALEQLPEEYRGKQQDILCNDCEKKGRAPFHWLYHKCCNCGSYNTRAI